MRTSSPSVSRGIESGDDRLTTSEPWSDVHAAKSAPRATAIDRACTSPMIMTDAKRVKPAQGTWIGSRVPAGSFDPRCTARNTTPAPARTTAPIAVQNHQRSNTLRGFFSSSVLWTATAVGGGATIDGAPSTNTLEGL